MCGIVGLISSEYRKEYFELFKELMKESEVRGKHASGFSFVKEGKVITIKASKNSREFMKSFSEVKSNLFLGHTRYSTSDLKVNQPLSRSGVSIAHNGVITQLPKGEWKKEYGYETETDNDSELLLRCILDGEFDEVQDKFKGSSISVGILNKGGLYFFRNGQRPLWKIEIKKEGEVKVIVFCSTQSIFLRALKNTEVLPTSYLNGTNLVIEETQPGVIYVALPKRNCVKTKDFTIANIIKDLQNERL